MTTKTTNATEPQAGEPLTDFQRGMVLLREPFPESQIGLLPRATNKQDTAKFECVEQNGRRVSADGKYCGGYHTRSMHVDFVGHATVTDRLLRVDPLWSWEPVAWDPQGLPLITNGGLWIRLTILGVTRLGFGDAPGKTAATKELIGDAIRNAAMRFGVALDLWAKGDLLADQQERGSASEEPQDGGSRASTTSRGSAQQGTPPSPPAAAPAVPTVDWVAEVAQTASRPEVQAVYKRARAAGELASVIHVDGKQQTVGEYITAWGVAVNKAEAERAKAAKQQDSTDNALGYDENEPI